MTPTEHQKRVMMRASSKFHDTLVSPRLLHAVLGVASEAGELVDPIKAALFYGKAVDTVNVAEELGDVLWFVQLAANELGTTIEELLAINDAKLERRYPLGFTEDAALNRDLEKERSVLEDTRPSYKEELAKIPSDEHPQLRAMAGNELRRAFDRGDLKA